MANKSANKTGNSKNNIVKIETSEIQEEIVEAENIIDDKKEKVTSSTPTKKKLKLDDDVLILVKSNVFGKLIYINHKTGDETQWENYGDVQSISVGDLRAMKAKQLDFFKENWILIVGVEDTSEEFDEVETKEIYDALQVYQYYKNTLCPDDINQVFNWSISDIKNKVPNMTNSVKSSIIIRANELIKSGVLDSIGKVKALEEILGCDLTTTNEDE